MRILVCGVLLCCMFLGAPPGLGQMSKHRDKRLPASKLGRMWVVNANVKEHEPKDARNHSDVRRFVFMAMNQTYVRAPDVVLLQEVNEAATRFLAGAFTRRTGNRFAIAVTPHGPTKTVGDRGTVTRDDSAILFNASATRVTASGKFQVIQRRATASRRPMRQVVPWATIIERGKHPDRLRMVAASIHYPKHSAFRTRKMSYSHKARWSAKLNRLLGQRVRSSSSLGGIPVLAGDFNGLKCVLGTSDNHENCRPTKLWTRMRRLRYKEALEVGEYRRMDRKIIDFSFTQGNVSRVRFDYSYHEDSGAEYYSDHGVMAALLEDEDTTPPKPPNSPECEIEPNGDVRLYEWEGGWRGSGGRTGWDGGSGLKDWLVSRRGPGQEQFKLIGRVRDHLQTESHFIDDTVVLVDDKEYLYEIRAIDRAGNISLGEICTVVK